MSLSVESKTPYFGLRDFLFYLVPGAILLLAILISPVIKLESYIESKNGLLIVISILVSYYLGHVIYPLNYLIRKLLFSNIICDKEKENKKCNEDCPDFRFSYINASKKTPNIHVSEIARYRSLSHFSCAMVFPTLLLSLSIISFAMKQSSSDKIYMMLFGILLLISISGFCWRAIRYQKKYIDFVKKCSSCAQGEKK